MKAKLEFNYEIEGDELKHRQCINAQKMAGFIWELHHNFWRKWKHDESGFNLDSYKESLCEMMEVYNINPDDLLE